MSQRSLIIEKGNIIETYSREFSNTCCISQCYSFHFISLPSLNKGDVKYVCIEVHELKAKYFKC